MLQRKEKEFIIQSWRQDPRQGTRTNPEHHDASEVTVPRMRARGPAGGGTDAESRGPVMGGAEAQRMASVYLS